MLQVRKIPLAVAVSGSGRRASGMHELFGPAEWELSLSTAVVFKQ